MLFYRLFYPSQLERIEGPYSISSKSKITRIKVKVNPAEDEKNSGYCDWKITIITRKKDDTHEYDEKWKLPGLLSPNECLSRDFILRIEAKPKSHH